MAEQSSKDKTVKGGRLVCCRQYSRSWVDILPVFFYADNYCSPLCGEQLSKEVNNNECKTKENFN